MVKAIKIISIQEVNSVDASPRELNLGILFQKGIHHELIHQIIQKWIGSKFKSCIQILNQDQMSKIKNDQIKSSQIRSESSQIILNQIKSQINQNGQKSNQIIQVETQIAN